jgi:hypothetical protein
MVVPFQFVRASSIYERQKLRVPMNSRRSGSLCWLFACIVLQCMCSQSIDRDQVVGRYSGNHGKGIDQIELRPDGSYLYACRLSDGKEFSNSDRWTLDYANQEARITLDHFTSCLQQHGATPGYWDMPVEKSWSGTLRLALNPDLGYYYVRQKP